MSKSLILGDIAFRYLKYLKNSPASAEIPSHVTLADINQHMLDEGKKRAEKLEFIDLQNSRSRNTIDWICANAESLPFENCSFSAYTIAYGIRNCTHIDKVT